MLHVECLPLPTYKNIIFNMGQRAQLKRTTNDLQEVFCQAVFLQLGRAVRREVRSKPVSYRRRQIYVNVLHTC